jgi:hypothetical protein
MPLDFNEVYTLFERDADDEVHTLVMAPRTRTIDGKRAIQVITTSDTPGFNVHTLLGVEFVEETATSIRLRADDLVEARFELLTIERWSELFPDSVGRDILLANAKTDAALRYLLWESYVDSTWIENP